MENLKPQNILAVGIDTASKSHHAVVTRFPEEVLLDEHLPNCLPGFENLDLRVQELAQQYGLTVVYGIEGSGSYGRALADFLLEKGRDVREVKSIKVNRQKAYYGQDKSDQIDARAAAAVVLRSFADLPRAPERDEVSEGIRKASRRLDQLVKEQTRNLNQLHAEILETYQGLSKILFEDLGTNTALSFYQAYPAPQDLEGLSVTKLGNFLSKASRGTLGKGKGSRARKKAKQILTQAKPLIESAPAPGQELQAEIIRGLCRQILASKEIIAMLKSKLKKDLLPQAGLKLETVTGIETRCAALLIGETRGIERFHSNDAYARYNGTAPAKHSSGGKQKHRARKDCNHRLKRVFHQIAFVNYQHDPLGQAYYQACISSGLSHNEALKRLARRLSDIVYAMMRDRSEYDPAIAKASMERRNSKCKKTGEVARREPTVRDDKSLASPVDKYITEEAEC